MRSVKKLFEAQFQNKNQKQKFQENDSQAALEILGELSDVVGQDFSDPRIKAKLVQWFEKYANDIGDIIGVAPGFTNDEDY